MTRGHTATLATSVVAVLLLARCTSVRPMSEMIYAAYAEGMRGSPELRRTEIRDCIAKVRRTPRQRDLFRQLLNLAPGRDPMPVACRRIADAVVFGRLTYEDMQLSRAGQLSPKFIRIVQGR